MIDFDEPLIRVNDYENPISHFEIRFLMRDDLNDRDYKNVIAMREIQNQHHRISNPSNDVWTLHYVNDDGNSGSGKIRVRNHPNQHYINLYKGVSRKYFTDGYVWLSLQEAMKNKMVSDYVKTVQI